MYITVEQVLSRASSFVRAGGQPRCVHEAVVLDHANLTLSLLATPSEPPLGLGSKIIRNFISSSFVLRWTFVGLSYSAATQ